MNFFIGRNDPSGCHASAQRGTPYPCSQKDIDRACRLSRQRKEGGFVGINPAIEDVIHYNRLDRTDPAPVATAVSRLRDAIQRSERHKWGRDIIIKAGSLHYTKLGLGVLNLCYVRRCWTYYSVFNRPVMTLAQTLCHLIDLLMRRSSLDVRGHRSCLLRRLASRKCRGDMGDF